MWFKKKRNILLITITVVICFMLYQLYFFVAISNEGARNAPFIHVIDNSDLLEIVHVFSEDDKYINQDGAIRGVLRSSMPRYRANNQNQFKCLMTEQYIPFEHLNDDYCDCEDSTDEPSTNACVNGTFYCHTQYQKKPAKISSIPSSQVNDGVCDCCDGSDEWNLLNNRVLTQAASDLRRHYAETCPNVC